MIAHAQVAPEQHLEQTVAPNENLHQTVDIMGDQYQAPGTSSSGTAINTHGDNSTQDTPSTSSIEGATEPDASPEVTTLSNNSPFPKRMSFTVTFGEPSSAVPCTSVLPIPCPDCVLTEESRHHICSLSKPDPFHTEFPRFPDLAAEVRAMIFNQAALAEPNHIITTTINSVPWKVIHQSPQVVKAAKNLYPVFELGLVSKEARKAALVVCTSYIFVENNFRNLKFDSVRKLHFRPDDLLYIQDIPTVAQRLFDPYIRFHELGFGKGVKKMIFPEPLLSRAMNEYSGLRLYFSSFLPELKVIYLTGLEQHEPCSHFSNVYDVNVCVGEYRDKMVVGSGYHSYLWLTLLNLLLKVEHEALSKATRPESEDGSFFHENYKYWGFMHHDDPCFGDGAV